MFTLNELCRVFPTLTCVGGQQQQISGLNRLDQATALDATFLIDHRYRSALRQTRAGVLIVNLDAFPYAREEFSGSIWHISDPLPLLNYLGKCLEQDRFGSDECWSQVHIHPSAIIEADAQIHEQAQVGPYCVIRRGAVLEAGVILLAYNYVGCFAKLKEKCFLGVGATVLAHTEIGARTRIMPGAVIGSQGFGVLRNSQGQNTRIPQLGSVVIGPDSRIGCNATVDRGSFGPTRLGERNYLDNLTQVGHNAQAGNDFIVCSQSGMTGSSKVGDRVTIAALSGLKDHVSVTDDVTITGFTGVTKNWDTPHTTLGGYPAEPLSDYFRRVSANKQVPELLTRVKALETEFSALKQLLADKRVPTPRRPQNRRATSSEKGSEDHG